MPRDFVAPVAVGRVACPGVPEGKVALRLIVIKAFEVLHTASQERMRNKVLSSIVAMDLTSIPPLTIESCSRKP